MSIYIVEGERTVKEKVLFVVDGISKYTASVNCRKGKTIREFVLSKKQITEPTNFKHIGIMKQLDKEKP